MTKEELSDFKVKVYKALIQKNVKKRIRELEELGFRTDRRKAHVVLYYGKTGMFTMAVSCSDARGAKNLCSDIIRAVKAENNIV